MRLLTRLEKDAALPRLLSSREVEVLRLLARGKTNQQIAGALLVSVNTVKKHVCSVISKLRVSDRSQAIVKAVELSMVAWRRKG